MKKLVRVSTDLQVTIHDYPEGSYQMQNKALRKLICTNRLAQKGFIQK